MDLGKIADMHRQPASRQAIRGVVEMLMRHEVVAPGEDVAVATSVVGDIETGTVVAVLAIAAGDDAAQRANDKMATVKRRVRLR